MSELLSEDDSFDLNGLHLSSALQTNDDYGPIHFALEQDSEEKALMLLELLMPYGLDVNLRFVFFEFNNFHLPNLDLRNLL